jgi:hypothetical protein
MCSLSLYLSESLTYDVTNVRMLLKMVANTGGTEGCAGEEFVDVHRVSSYREEIGIH